MEILLRSKGINLSVTHTLRDMEVPWQIIDNLNSNRANRFVMNAPVPLGVYIHIDCNTWKVTLTPELPKGIYQPTTYEEIAAYVALLGVNLFERKLHAKPRRSLFGAII